MLVKQQHQAIAGRQAQQRVAIKAGGNLYDIEIAAFQAAIFDVNLALFHDQLTNRGDIGPASGIVTKAILDQRKGIKPRQDLLYLVAVQYFQDQPCPFRYFART